MESPNLEAQAKQCADLIAQAQSIAVLSGAGISTAAGIPDFRGPQGLYITRQYDPEKVFDIEYFHKDPKLFFDFARDFVGMEEKIEPTLAHRFWAALDGQEKVQGIITQNIDSLHQKAGSRKVLEMHGSFWKNYCFECHQEFAYNALRDKLQEQEIPRCICDGVIKPDVVFFGENVKYLDEAYELAHKADLFFVIGTSCVVYPAAMLPDVTEGKIVVVNRTPVLLRSPNVVLSVQEDINNFFKKVAAELSLVL